MADYVLPVTTTMLTPMDEPERGWCDRCNLTSLLLWHLTIEANGRLLNDGITTLSICTDCGDERWT